MIFVDKNTRLLVQGITGAKGQFHTDKCIEYGTNVVAGVTPGKGGTKVLGVPVYNTVKEAKLATKANATMIFVPPAFAADAIFEAIDNEIELIVAITEGIPVHDMLRVKNYLVGKKSVLLGPNCPGIISPGACKIGIQPGSIHMEGGPIGVVSRSGTLTYEAVNALTENGFGQTTCIGIGGDPVKGLGFIDCIKAFNEDPETKGIVMIGEIGGSEEVEAAKYIKEHVKKPVVGFIAGMSAPPGKRMGHAGAIISNSNETAQAKIKIMKECGIDVCECLGSIEDTFNNSFKSLKQFANQ